jgi:hypothetical protein
VDLESDGTPEGRRQAAGSRQVPRKIAEAVGDMKVSTEQHRGTELRHLKTLLAFNHKMSCGFPYTRGSNSCLDVPDEVET